jgi:hypothetical protein
VITKKTSDLILDSMDQKQGSQNVEYNSRNQYRDLQNTPNIHSVVKRREEAVLKALDRFDQKMTSAALRR